MFDVHMHVIPGVDDGARDMAMAREMLEMAWAQGVRAVIATPHSSAFRRPEAVLQRFGALKDWLEAQDWPMALRLGCEVLFAGDNTGDAMARLTSGELPALNGTEYVLAEFMPSVGAAYVLNVAQRLRAAGFVPVVAHAERCPGVFGNPGRAAAIHRLALLQINAYSLAEEWSDRIQQTARMLLENRLVDFVGSDAHRLDHRAPAVAAGVQYIRDHCDPAYARAVLWGNARRLLRLGGHPYMDGLLGLAVGDALGVPYEGRTAEDMRREPCAGMAGGMAHRQKPGTWSDDTSMALCVADSLGSRGLDPDDAMKKFSEWRRYGRYTAGGVAFDVGRTCRRAIDRYDQGAPPALCGDRTEAGNGNGGLMRALPIALYACLNRDSGSLDALLQPVHDYSALTHGHAVGLICCGLYALFIREWLRRSDGDGVFDAMDRAIEAGRAHYRAAGGAFAEAIDRPGLFLSAGALKALDGAALPATGYVMDTWNIAAWSLLNTDNYRDCVLRAVNLGGDADTNAAVAGSLAGLVYGSEDIPAEWLAALRNRALILRLARRLDDGGAEDGATIDDFTGEYGFLAMKAPAQIKMDGVTYANLTAAWLAQGVPEAERPGFARCNAHQARRRFRQLPCRPDWEAVSETALRNACRTKFDQNPGLAAKLLATGARPIVYDTTGSHDNLLGRCRCPQCRDGRQAQNRYGVVLMETRNRLRGVSGTDDKKERE